MVFNRKNKEKGQSLLEVVIALGVTILVVLALVWVTTLSVRNADFAKKQTQASAYAQEGMENIRAYRDQGWANFIGLLGGESQKSLEFSGTVPSAGSCPLLPNLPPFKRCVTLVNDGEKIKATVTVSWEDSAGPHQSELVSYFTQWQ